MASDLSVGGADDGQGLVAAAELGHAVEEAQAQRRLGIYVLRELRDTPRSIANAYWDGWGLRLGAGMRILQDIASTSDLPPPPPDGRLSWRQAFFELSLFMVAAFLLILITYFGGADAGWRREPDVLGRVITSLTLPFLFLGLARGSPRWASSGSCRQPPSPGGTGR